MGDYIAWEEVISFQLITVSEKGQYAKGVSGSDPGQPFYNSHSEKRWEIKHLESKLIPTCLELGLGIMLGVCVFRGGKWDGTKRQRTENKVSEWEYSVDSKHV